MTPTAQPTDGSSARITIDLATRDALWRALRTDIDSTADSLRMSMDRGTEGPHAKLAARRLRELADIFDDLGWAEVGDETQYTISTPERASLARLLKDGRESLKGALDEERRALAGIRAGDAAYASHGATLAESEPATLTQLDEYLEELRACDVVLAELARP